MLSTLKERNRHLNFVDIDSNDFDVYGKFLGTAVWSELTSLARKTVAAEEEPAYIASMTSLEKLDLPEPAIRAFAGEEVQVGVCRGFNKAMNGMEWHDCPEIIVAVTPVVLILGLTGEMEGDEWNSRHARVCLLDAGEAVLLNSGTLHFAPCRTNDYPFLSIIILAKGVNEELEESDGKGEEPDHLLRAKRKWLMAHPDSPQAANGVPGGILGPNLEIRTL